MGWPLLTVTPRPPGSCAGVRPSSARVRAPGLGLLSGLGHSNYRHNCPGQGRYPYALNTFARVRAMASVENSTCISLLRPWLAGGPWERCYP